MNLKFQRKLAAEILDCGVHRVWMDPDALDEIAGAATKEDVRELIERGLIKRKPVNGISRARINKRKAQRKKGRRRGHGRRKGRATARMPRKRAWIIRIRALRKRLRQLKKEGALDAKTYRMLYRKAKGGEFRSIAHLNQYLETHGLLR
ncbi:50S ribosomal protein L19e [Geoglobus acetivorans]|uniref:Large ribosomal subunit protein eL19 n=1 Tax=Geoglobus acetivorans TaxID=565033 RepID=A0A0A7GGT0_GEOAI|nr:LSU ribosomal protein L19e [Geoglobus acetivorans]